MVEPTNAPGNQQESVPSISRKRPPTLAAEGELLFFRILYLEMRFLEAETLNIG